MLMLQNFTLLCTCAYVHRTCTYMYIITFEFSYKWLRNAHSFPSILQKMSSANGCFSVEGTWETNMAFLAEFNEETPKGWWKVLVLKEDFLPISLHPLISTLSTLPSQLYPLNSTLSTLPSQLYPLNSTLSSLPSHLHPLISTLSSPPSHLHPLISTLSSPTSQLQSSPSLPLPLRS